MFGFADQEKTTYGLGYRLTLKRNNNNDAIVRDAGVEGAKINIKQIEWCVLHYIPNIENQTLVKEQILNKEPTELSFIERSVFRKNVNSDNNWTLN